MAVKKIVSHYSGGVTVTFTILKEWEDKDGIKRRTLRTDKVQFARELPRHNREAWERSKGRKHDEHYVSGDRYEGGRWVPG